MVRLMFFDLVHFVLLYRFKDQVLQVKRNYTVRRTAPVCNRKTTGIGRP